MPACRCLLYLRDQKVPTENREAEQSADGEQRARGSTKQGSKAL